MNALLLELQQLEAELHHPGVPCSRERLDALLHPQFHEVGRSGRPYQRDFVVDFLAGQSVMPTVEATGHAVALLAEGCALLTFRSARRLPDGSMTEQALRSSIWLHTPVGWQLYYHQGTPAAPGN